MLMHCQQVSKTLMYTFEYLLLSILHNTLQAAENVAHISVPMTS